MVRFSKQLGAIALEARYFARLPIAQLVGHDGGAAPVLVRVRGVRCVALADGADARPLGGAAEHRQPGPRAGPAVDAIVRGPPRDKLVYSSTKRFTRVAQGFQQTGGGPGAAGNLLLDRGGATSNFDSRVSGILESASCLGKGPGGLWSCFLVSLS